MVGWWCAEVASERCLDRTCWHRKLMAQKGTVPLSLFRVFTRFGGWMENHYFSIIGFSGYFFVAQSVSETNRRFVSYCWRGFLWTIRWPQKSVEFRLGTKKLWFLTACKAFENSDGWSSFETFPLVQPFWFRTREHDPLARGTPSPSVVHWKKNLVSMNIEQSHCPTSLVACF